MPAVDSPRVLVGIEAIADQLGVTVRWVRRRVAAREIPFFKLGHLVRFDPTEVRAWVNESRVPTTAERSSDNGCTRSSWHPGSHRVAGPRSRPVAPTPHAHRVRSTAPQQRDQEDLADET